MASDSYKMSANKLSKFLDKPCHDFTKQDIIKYVEHNDIKAVNLRHVGGWKT